MMDTSNVLDNLQQDRFEIISVQVVLELLSSALLFSVIYYTYKGIEIRHPVYAILFCDLIVALASSLTNAVIIPLVPSMYTYTSLANGSNMFCLVFHSCCWCILSIQRYLYITKKTWLEQKFPEPSGLLKVSLLSLIILVTFNVASGLTTVIYCGYPRVKIMDMRLEHKIPCVIVLLCNYVVMVLVSCWCYIEILRQRGKFGQNSVNIINNDNNNSHADSSGLSFVESIYQEITARENFELRNLAIIESQSLLKQQKAEIDSAILSLKTNLSFFLVLIFFFLSAAFFASEIFAISLSILTNLAPILTCTFSFVKMRTLMLNFWDELVTKLVFCKDVICCKKLKFICKINKIQ
jgi:hypothetical protein